MLHYLNQTDYCCLWQEANLYFFVLDQIIEQSKCQSLKLYIPSSEKNSLHGLGRHVTVHCVLFVIRSLELMKVDCHRLDFIKNRKVPLQVHMMILKDLKQHSTNFIFACTDFGACKMVLHARSCMQNYVYIKQ